MHLDSPSESNLFTARRATRPELEFQVLRRGPRILDSVVQEGAQLREVGKAPSADGAFARWTRVDLPYTQCFISIRLASNSMSSYVTESVSTATA